MAEKRERALQSLKNKYPDREFAEDEDITDPLNGVHGGVEDYKTRNSETNQKLIEVLDAEPELVEVIKALIAGNIKRSTCPTHRPTGLTTNRG
jgi:hypothetical protein